VEAVGGPGLLADQVVAVGHQLAQPGLNRIGRHRPAHLRPLDGGVAGQAPRIGGVGLLAAAAAGAEGGDVGRVGHDGRDLGRQQGGEQRPVVGAGRLEHDEPGAEGDQRGHELGDAGGVVGHPARQGGAAHRSVAFPGRVQRPPTDIAADEPRGTGHGTGQEVLLADPARATLGRCPPRGVGAGRVTAAVVNLDTVRRTSPRGGRPGLHCGCG